MAGFLFKRGTTFLLTADVTDDHGAPVDLTGTTVACQLRDALGELIATPIATLSTSSTGRLVIAYGGDTTAWPLATLRMDLSFGWADATRSSSETFTITVVDRVTT